MVRYCTNNTKSLHSPASHHYFPRLWYRYFECGGKRTSDKLHGNPDANSHFHPHFNPSPYSYAYASSNLHPHPQTNIYPYSNTLSNNHPYFHSYPHSPHLSSIGFFG